MAGETAPEHSRFARLVKKFSQPADTTIDPIKSVVDQVVEGLAEDLGREQAFQDSRPMVSGFGPLHRRESRMGPPRGELSHEVYPTEDDQWRLQAMSKASDASRNRAEQRADSRAPAKLGRPTLRDAEMKRILQSRRPAQRHGMQAAFTDGVLTPEQIAAEESVAKSAANVAQVREAEAREEAGQDPMPPYDEQDIKVGGMMTGQGVPTENEVQDNGL